MNLMVIRYGMLSLIIPNSKLIRRHGFCYHIGIKLITLPLTFSEPLIIVNENSLDVTVGV